jgi:hypothetical protein
MEKLRGGSQRDVVIKTPSPVRSLGHMLNDDMYIRLLLLIISIEICFLFS